MDYLFSSKDLKKLIIPLVFEQALAITVGMADTMMVASVGEAAISGVSLVDMINNLIFSILAALSTGGAVVVSQFIGARHVKDACRCAWQLLYTAVFISLLISIATIIWRLPLLRLFFGAIEDDVMQDAIIYLLISAFSFPFLAIYNACAALFRSMGNAAVTLKVSILINLINVVGNAVCIFVLKMGVAGVAIPSLVSRMAGAVILFILLHNDTLMVHLKHGQGRPNLPIIRKILHIGIPSGIENGIFQLGRVLVVSIISGFGTVQIAANGVANNLDSLGVIIGQAMNLAMITVIGRCVGAGDERQIRYYTRRLLLITYISTAILNGLILLNLNRILAIYGLSAQATGLAAKLVWLHDGFAILLWPLAFVLPNMLRACNDVNYTMVVSLFSMFVFRIGFSYVLGVRMNMGAVGVWIAMIIDWVVRISFFIGRYLSGRWRRLCHLEKAQRKGTEDY